MHSIHKMRPIATDGVAWSVCLCVGHVRKPCQNGETDRDAVLGADAHGHKEPCIRRGQHRTNPFAAARGDTSAMRPFANYFEHLSD